MNEMTHQDLVIRAEKWLNRAGCHITFRELCACTSNSENPDVIGWVGGRSVLVECKASRSDFHADKRKLFRQFPEIGMGSTRVYFCPPEVIKPDDLPTGWLLAWCYPKRVVRVGDFKNMSHRANSWPSPFTPHRKAEMDMLLSALRRLHIRGHLDEIYEGIPTNTNEGGGDE